MNKKLTCYHVRTSGGGTYGAAATSKRDAMLFVQERLTADDEALDGLPPEMQPIPRHPRERPVSAESVGSCDWDYGTVLCYSYDSYE